MKLRLITTAIWLPIAIVVLIFSHTFILPIAVSVFAAIGVFEMFGCIGMRKFPSITVPSVIFAAAMTFLARYGIMIADRKSYVLGFFAAFSFIYLFYLMCISVVSKGTKSIGETVLAAVMTLYITVGFASMILLRDMRSGANDIGVWLFALVLVGAWIPDSAAYFVGRAFGKHKLIPDVSPKKTVEGAIGGIIFGGIAFALCGLIAKLTLNVQPSYIPLALTGIVIAVVSIFGDLIASLIKRQYGIKDYGKIFPGHGGVMDRFDSILAIAPFLLMICSHPDIFAILI